MFAPSRFVLHLDYDSRTATVHRAERPCFPPRRPLLQRIQALFGLGRSRTGIWVPCPSIEKACERARLANSFTLGGVPIRPFNEFVMCWCTARGG